MNASHLDITNTSSKASLVAEEYNALREEILKHIEFRYQLINLTLISAGTLLAAGVQDGVSPSVLLVYPLLSSFLAAGWVYNGKATLEIGTYIKEEIEAKNVGANWETYQFRKYPIGEHAGLLGTLSAWGIFLGSQIITLAVALVLLENAIALSDAVLLAADAIAVVFTCFSLLSLTRFWRH